MIAVETAVVGGGPAGAATACALAASGREVMLLERTAKPKNKVCGEFLSRDTQAYLARLGVDPVELGAVPIDQMMVHAGRRSVAAPLPFRALSLSRLRLDCALLERAALQGADVRRGVVVRAVRKDNESWNLDCDIQDGVRCRNLVVATGKVGLRGIADGRDWSSVGLKIHFRPSARTLRALDRKVELFLWSDGYAGLELIEDGVANLCLAVRRTVASRLHSDVSRLWDYLGAASPLLAERLEDAAPLWAKPLSVVFPSGGYLHAEVVGSDSAYRVGDRLAHIPPFAGDGIGIALCSAALAADHIRQRRPAAFYLTAARSRIGKAVRLAGTVAWLGGNGVGRAALMSAASIAPAFLPTVAQWTRVDGD